MESRIFELKGKNFKVIGFNSEKLIFSSKKHLNFNSLLASCDNKGLLELNKIIPLHLIEKMDYNQKNEYVNIYYKNNNGKDKKKSIQFTNTSLINQFLDELSNEKKFEKKIFDESKTKPLIFNIIKLIIVISLSYIARVVAIDAENGVHHRVTGRKSGYINILIDIIELIGSAGITIIGVLAILFIIFLLIKRFKKPGKEIIYY